MSISASRCRFFVGGNGSRGKAFKIGHSRDRGFSPNNRKLQEYNRNPGKTGLSWPDNRKIGKDNRKINQDNRKLREYNRNL